MLRLVQVNLKHCIAATENLLIFMKTNINDIDIALIQEPWVNRNLIKGLTCNEYNLFYKIPDKDCKPRACILAKKNINAFLLNNFSNDDTAAVVVESDGKSITLVSAYLSHDEEIPSEVFKELATLSSDVIIGCDANARHVAWGNDDTNERGESLAYFINEYNFELHNRGDIPTFIFPSSKDNPGWEAILDITISKSSRNNLVDNWRVSLEDSFSDHRFILFNIDIKPFPTCSFRNARKTDWDKFKKIVYSKLKVSETPVVSSVGKIEEYTNRVTEVFDKAFKVSCRIPRRRKKIFPDYFDKEIIELRRRVRQQFNVSYKSGDWESYKKLSREYKSKRRIAKSVAWKDFCGEIDSIKDTARLRKILAKTPSPPTFIMNDDGNWANTSEETNKILLETHFPGCSDSCNPNVAISDCTQHSKFAEETITVNKVKWAINSFNPYKSAGPDGIIPKMLQVTASRIAPLLVAIFRSCIRLGHIPTSWNKVKVVFIPKAGKANHCRAKDFRPISLSSFLLKTLERILDEYIRSLFNLEMISPAQHAYIKGRSVETALHDTVRTIESALQYKQFTLAAFLDIEGAFNNVKLEAIVEALFKLKVDLSVISWISNMLRSREINSTIGGSSLTKFVSRGTPQGGVLSPLLWLLVVNGVLKALEDTGIRVVAYADDVVLLVPGLFPDTLSERIEIGLTTLSRWANSCGLGINPSKTELVLFKSGYKTPSFKLPSMNGLPLELSDKAKFLGVTLDSRLTWKPNLEERVRKAQIAFFVCHRAIGKSWGLNPKQTKWILTSVVRPILLYAVVVWWIALLVESNCNKLDRLIRMVCIGITGALRTTSKEALFNTLHILPSDLFSQEVAAKTAVRLIGMGRWYSKPYGHSNILNFLKLRSPKNLDACITEFNFRKNYSVALPRRSDWSDDNLTSNFDLVVFTDGSKKDTGCGAGFYVKNNNFKSCHRLPNESSIFQCEIYAVKMAIMTINSLYDSSSNIVICVDSQAALKALDSFKISSTLVRECRDLLNSLGRQREITLMWVPGHSGVEGNDVADYVANCGADRHISWVETIPLPLSSPLMEIREVFAKKRQKYWRDSNGVFKLTLGPQLESTSKFLLNLNKSTLRKATFALTGFWPLGRHARRIGIKGDHKCPGCGLTAMETDCIHFWCACPALCRLRLELFGQYSINMDSELPFISISKKLDFILKSRWF